MININEENADKDKTRRDNNITIQKVDRRSNIDGFDFF